VRIRHVALELVREMLDHTAVAIDLLGEPLAGYIVDRRAGPVIAESRVGLDQRVEALAARCSHV
jgi:hypothetical protein